MMGHINVVQRIKNDLEARNFDLSGPDGAFQITKRVAWELRAEGAGLLDKPSGSNSQGFATDIICYPNGDIADILSDSGGTNGPAWNVREHEVDPSRYRPAFGPFDVPNDPPPIVLPPVVPSPANDEILKRLEALKVQSDANTEKIQQQIDQVVKDAEATLKKLIPLIEGGNIIGSIFGKK